MPTFQNIPANTSLSYWQHIWNNKVNRNCLLFGLGLMISQFMIFKLLYPFPDFFSDSYSYIYAAYRHLNISIWPIGYSKFLSYIRSLTYSDNSLVGVQYFFLQLAAMHFFFTITYFYRTTELTQKILFLFLFVNPLALYLCNTINSDALFCALSMLWITQLIWILQKPRVYQVLIQAVLLFLCFTVRNNAYYYPLISAFAFIISRQNWKIKVIGIVAPFFFIIPFISYTETEAFKITGTKQYSLFTGWQLANNALYIYDQIEIDSSTLPTPESKELNQLAIVFFNKRKNSNIYRSYLESFEGNYFIKDTSSPLKKYTMTHYINSKVQYEKTEVWGKSSAAFQPFGEYIISHYPLSYIWYFIRPNILHYFLPPLTHLELYNYGNNDIPPIVKHWFHYKTDKVHCISHKLQGLLIVYTALFLLFNLYFLYQLLNYIRNRKEFLIKGADHSSYLLTAVFLLINFVFSVSVTVNILRYQIIPMVLLLAFSLLISDSLEKKQLRNKSTRRNLEYQSPEYQLALNKSRK